MAWHCCCIAENKKNTATGGVFSSGGGLLFRSLFVGKKVAGKVPKRLLFCVLCGIV